MSKLKFNILDLVIILIVAAVACVGLYLFTRVNKTEASKGTPATVEFTVEVKDLTQDMANAFVKAKGKTVVYGTKNSDHGVITDVKIEDYRRMSRNLENGTVFWDTYPGKYQVLVTIKTDIYEREFSFNGNTEEIRIGMKMPFSGGGIASPEGFIVALNKLEGGLK